MTRERLRLPAGAAAPRRLSARATPTACPAGSRTTTRRSCGTTRGFERPRTLDEIFTTQYFGGERGTGTAYRPVLLLSYAVQWWIHGGEPAAFHAVNVLLHGAATLLLARLLLTLGIAPPAALASALLFAVHPIHVEAVTSIVGRGETQAAALVLGYLLLGLRFADRRGQAVALVVAGAPPVRRSPS